MHESDDHQIFFGGGASGAVNRYEKDELSLTTIGVDVGSSTFHFMFTALHLKRKTGTLGLVVVERDIRWRSPVYLTPYRGSVIDASAVSLAIGLGHQAARIPPDHVDGGAVILTGDALLAENARALAEEIGSATGKVMSVSAGHQLEAMLAAFGSGAVGIAREHDRRLLHVDIGGGTTKFAAIDGRGVRQTAAINGGGRIVAFDGEGRIARVGRGARPLCEAAGIELAPGAKLSERDAQRLAETLADAIVAVVNGYTEVGVEPDLRLTAPLDRDFRPEAISFSGGVSEYLYGREQRSFGDIGGRLGEELRRRFDEEGIALPLIEPGEGIRATVIGAAQSTLNVSANAVDPKADAVLPLNNVLVLHPHIDAHEFEASQIASAVSAELELFGAPTSEPIALSMSWDGPTDEVHMRRLAEGIRAGLGSIRAVPSVVLLEQPIAAELEKALEREITAGPIICLEGVHLSSLDYLDVGRRIEPAGVVPLVVKSLLFDVQDHHHHVDHHGSRD